MLEGQSIRRKADNRYRRRWCACHYDGHHNRSRSRETVIKETIKLYDFF